MLFYVFLSQLNNIEINQPFFDNSIIWKGLRSKKRQDWQIDGIFFDYNGLGGSQLYFDYWSLQCDYTASTQKIPHSRVGHISNISLPS